MTEATRLEPRPTALTTPFWDATRDQQLLVQWCTACDRGISYPREVCPTCLGTELEWRAAKGTGTVYAVTVEHKPQNPMMAALAPYAVALVDLDDGIRMLTNVINCDPATVNVGDPVRIAWEPLSDGRHLPQFEPVT